MKFKGLKALLLLLLLAGEAQGPQPVSVEANYLPLVVCDQSNLLFSPWPDTLLHQQRLHCGTTFLAAACIILIRLLQRSADLGMPVEQVLLRIYHRHQETLW